VTNHQRFNDKFGHIMVYSGKSKYSSKTI